MEKRDISANELTDKLLSGRISRRQYLQTLSAVGLGLVMVPATSRNASAAAADQATYFTWGGYDDAGMFGPYIAKHGEPPNFAVYGDSEEGFTKMRAGYVIDIFHPCNSDLPRMQSSGLFQPIDTGRLPQWGNVMGKLKTLPGAQVDGKQWFCPFEWGQTSITYRPDLFDLGGKEESWSMLWDERYAGRVSLIEAAGDTWWIAAIYAGVPFEEMGTPENHEKIKALLRKQRPLSRMYTSDQTTLVQAIASGELIAAMTWNEVPVQLKKQGIPVKWANPKEGALTWVCGIMLHKDAPHLDRAYDIIDSMLAPQTGKYVVEEFGYGHCNLETFKQVTPEKLAELGLSINPSDMLDAGKYQIPISEELSTSMDRDFEEVKAGF